jgi:cell division protein FtsW
MSATVRLPSQRNLEAFLLGIVLLFGLLGATLLALGLAARDGLAPTSGLPGPLVPVGIAWGAAAAVHLALRAVHRHGEPYLLPIVTFLLTVGMLLIWRLRGAEGAYAQLVRGVLPGFALMGLLILRPALFERLRRVAIPVGVVGLILPILTAFFGEVDETGARLALKFGPLPAIQPSEIIKLALIVFLAWFIDREGRAAEGRAIPFLGWLRLPAPRYFAPGLLYVGLAALALVQMSDLGAVLVLSLLFGIMLFVGFEPRLFLTVVGVGALLGLVVGAVLSVTWQPPATVRARFLAFRDPWSSAMIVVDGQPTGVTVSEGPGYQIQQSIYALAAGGLTGAGLGLGTPEYVPLAHSDFIFAALGEELGALIALAVLLLYGVLILRLGRIAVRLPPAQVFERMTVIGIALHLFVQVFVMVGGTLNLFPLTGVTIPFLSQGGVAVMVNLGEVGLALAAAQRLEVAA